MSSGLLLGRHPKACDDGSSPYSHKKYIQPENKQYCRRHHTRLVHRIAHTINIFATKSPALKLGSKRSLACATLVAAFRKTSPNLCPAIALGETISSWKGEQPVLGGTPAQRFTTSPASHAPQQVIGDAPSVTTSSSRCLEGLLFQGNEATTLLGHLTVTRALVAGGAAGQVASAAQQSCGRVQQRTPPMPRLN